MSNPSASIIIVTYNSSAYIINCLKSISRQKDVDYEIIIVDNNSSDNTAEKIQNHDIPVKLLIQDKNLGFSKANNIGVTSSKGDYLLFLNPDTEFIENDSLKKIQQTLINNPKYGIIGPQLILLDGSVQRSVRNLPTLMGAVKEYILKRKGTYEAYVPDCRDICEVESIVGACILMKKETFESVKGFNEKYFMYFEDLELCKKVRRLGFKIGYFPEVKIKHIEGASGFNQKTYQLLHTSAKQYHRPFSYYLVQLVIRVGNRLGI